MIRNYHHRSIPALVVLGSALAAFGFTVLGQDPGRNNEENDQEQLEEENAFSYYGKVQGRLIQFEPHPVEVVSTLTERDEVLDDRTISSVAEALQLEVTDKVAKNLGVVVYTTTDRRSAAEINNEVDALDMPELRLDSAEFTPAFIDSEGNTRYFLPGRITVQFKQGVEEDAALAEQRHLEVISSLGGEVVENQRTPGYYTVAIPREKSIFEAIRSYSERDDVLFAEGDEIVFESEDDNDSHDPQQESDFGLLWGTENTGQVVRGVAGTAGCDVSAVGAWQVTTGDPRVIVAVIDTGADLDHPDIALRLLERHDEDWDFADGPDAVPEDEGSHGTHVCGTVAAALNGEGVVGVAPGCLLMPLRIDLAAGRNANRADALNFVADKAFDNYNRRYVVNCSWRASGNYTAILVAIDNVVANNGLVLIAAGNSGLDMDVDGPQFPGAHPPAIAVAALNSDYRKSSFSNYGSQVDVSAPGENIWSTVPEGYGFKSGTSMACPHASAVAALIWSANFALSNAEVRQILEETCAPISTSNSGLAGKLGAGLVDAEAAVARARTERFVGDDNEVESEGEIVFYEGNGGSQDIVHVCSDAPGQNFRPDENDEARSVVLHNVRPGCVIRVFDDSRASRRDDYSIITVKRLSRQIIVRSFGETFENEDVSVIYIRRDNLDGKVSRVHVD